jgi:hypothetical protein
VENVGMKYLGNILLFAAVAAFIVPRLNFQLPEGVTIPTLPSDILGGALLLAGIVKKMYDDR